MEPLTASEDSAYCVMKGTLPSRMSVPLHSHGDAESFFVLSGEAQILLETGNGLEWQPLQRGDFTHIPGGTKHAWRNPFSDPFKAIVTTTPKLGRFLRELGELVTCDPAAFSPEQLWELSERYGYWTASLEENAAVGIVLNS